MLVGPMGDVEVLPWGQGHSPHKPQVHLLVLVRQCFLPEDGLVVDKSSILLLPVT